MSGQRAFSAGFENFSATNVAQDLVVIKSAAGGKARLLELNLTSNAVADAVVRLQLVRLASGYTAGLGGSAPTPTPLDDADSVATATARINDTTRATGTAVVIDSWQWDTRLPFVWQPIPETMPQVGGGAALQWSILGSPGTPVISGSAKWLEP